MGVNLTPIMIKHSLSLADLNAKRLAVDANNYLYQFLALLRTRDGTPLKDSHGNITSHLAGLLFRSTRLIRDYNIDLVFVFDGEPPELKREELRKRRENREKALEEWRKALRAGDYAKGFSKAVMTSRLTKPMIEDAKRLLLFLGIPFVQAPSEGEAQASYMAKRGDVWAASSKDYDGVLFGAPRLLRFLTIHGKEYLPSKGTTRPLKPEMIVLHEFLSSHRITHQQLVDIAILVGTDFNQGVKGTGPKTALKLIKEHKRIENLPGDYLSKVAPEFQKVRDIYFHPKTTSHYDMEYGSLLEDDLLHFLCDQRDFARNRVETAVHRMRAFYKERQQRKLEGWFKEKTCKQTNSSLLENLRRDVNSLKKAFVV